MTTPAVSLHRLLAGFTDLSATPDRPVEGLASDSRQVRRGDLFLARRGGHSHGLDFLADVLAAQPAAIAWEPPYPKPLPAGGDPPLLAVDQLSHRLGLIAERFHGSPARDLAVIGITGTDGKTSCAHFIAQALHAETTPCGIIGTLGWGVYGRAATATHTTPDALTLHRLLAELRAQRARFVAMEVSSHALDQRRVVGVPFQVAVLTNLTRDHLDYHGDVAAYAAAKRRLFTDYRPTWAVLNLDDEFGRRLAAELRGHTPVAGYSLSDQPALAVDAFVGCRRLTLSATGLELDLTTTWGNGRLNAALLGRFNASNLLASLATLVIFDIPLADALERLARVTTVAGRMERFGGGDRPLVVVDYAHTPHALEQTLRALRAHTTGRLWCVFGCGGDRDPGKRPLMGACAEHHADQVIVTDDNPRGEDSMTIIQGILGGMNNPARARVEPDRRAAIAVAIAGAAAGDSVLIAGKGHEDYQLVGVERRHFSDRAVVRACLEN